VEIVRTKTYAKAVKRLAKLGATVADIDEMEQAIIADPSQGDVIQGAGGLRKIRFAYGGVGKSGGGRTIYYVLDGDVLFLITAYAKVDKADVTAGERRLFKALIKELTDEREQD
jgi:hypothetical protein